MEYFSLDDATNTVDRSGYTEIKHKQEQFGNRIELASLDEIAGHHNRWAVGYEVARVNFRYFDNFYNGNDPSSTVPIHNPDPGSFMTIDPTAPDFKSTTTQQALFAEDAFDITSQLKFIVGLRQDWINVDHESLLTAATLDKDFSPFAYRFGAVFQATPRTAFYGQYSNGSDPISSIVTLRPSKGIFGLTSAEQVETGVKHTLPEGKGEVTLAAYHIAKDNIITRDPNNPLLRVQGGKQSSEGVELATTLLPAPHWRADFNVGILKARYDKLLDSTGASFAGNTPNDVPERVANAWVYYLRETWEAGLGARMVGYRYADAANTSVMPGYTVYDANIAWRPNAKTTLRASVRNLTDKVYAPVSYDTFQFILGESRRLEVSAEFNY